VLALAAIAGGTYLLARDDSSDPVATNASEQAQTTTTSGPDRSSPQPLKATGGHRLLPPECTPYKGTKWVYPIGPPIPGVPKVVANIRSNVYEVFAINFSCAKATEWIRKLSTLQVPIKRSGNVTEIKGPKGYYCSAWPDANGMAYAGGCQSEGGGDCVATKNPYGRPYANGRGCEIKGGNKAFGWNWNVANRRVVFTQDEFGKTHLIHVSGADTNVAFRYLKGKYQLDVLNTSGIGYLNGFTWAPSPGWSVKSIRKTSGANCSLTRDGRIHCTGTVRPPSCLCTGDGGMVTIEFTAVPTKKNAGYLFGGSAAQFKITKMTPVPYIIPGTPEQAAKRNGT